MPSLSDLITRWGADLVGTPVAPEGLERAYRQVVVYDPLDEPRFGPDDLVLAVGVAADSVAVLRCVRAGPAAVVLRHEGGLRPALLEEALACHVAVLTVPPATPWSLLQDIAGSLPARALAYPVPPVTGGQVVADLFALAAGLAEDVGAAITIEDNQSRLLAYSALHEGADAARTATILGHRVPDALRAEVRRLGIARRLLTETEPFFVRPDAPGIRPRTVVALRARQEVLGSIWAVTDAPFDERRRQAFAAAAESASVRLLHHRLATDLQRRNDDTTLAQLLAGGALGAEAARRAGLAGGRFRLLAVGLPPAPGSRPAGADEARLERCRRELATRLSVRGHPSLTGRIGGTVYAVVAGGDAADRVESEPALEGLDAEGPLLLALGEALEAPGELPAAREELDLTLRVLARRGAAGGRAEAGELALEVTLLRLADAGTGRRPGPLDPLETHDARHATHYGETVRAYLATLGDPAAACARLGVHPNTLRYRLRRLQDLFGLDLADADTRFALMLALRVRD